MFSDKTPPPTHLSGYYCPAGQITSQPFACQPGYFCPTGSHNMTLCGSGSYQNEAAAVVCKDCMAG